MVSKVYQNPEAALTFAPSGGTVVFDCAPSSTGLANGAGRQSAHHDLGTSARSPRFAWRAWCKPVSAPTVGTVVRVYIKTSDGTHPDNDDGTGDLAVSNENKLRNLHYIGSIVADEAATVEMVASGIIELPHRWVAVVFWNALGVAFSNTNTEHGFSLTPVPYEAQ